MKELLFLLVLIAGVALGQVTGDLQVTVHDSSGSAVPRASVIVKSQNTGTTRTLTTDISGAARANQLATGPYDMEVSRSGFEKITATAVVASGAASTVELTLSVGTVQDTVNVVGELTTVNSVNSQLQTNVDSQAILALPIASQGVLALATTAPGVIPVTANNPFLGLGSFNSNGGRGRGNNITIDGATATDVSTTGSAGLGTVPIDGIKEVALITNQFSAEFGRNASSQFQILTKSGSNQFHGSLFTFLKNSALSSRDYFDRTGSSTPLKDTDWGATVGGAIVKDKIFYFGTYEQEKVRGSGASRIANVPTPAQVATATPFAKSILDLYAVPITGTGTIATNASNLTDFKAFSGRVDANVTSRDFFYARAGHDTSTQNSSGNTFITSSLTGNGAYTTNAPWNATLSETHIFGPRVSNVFLASFGRSLPNFIPLAPTLGPEIAFQDATSNFGPWSGIPQGRTQNTFQYQDAVTATFGKHTLKFGAEYNRIQANSLFDSNVRGTITYTSLDNFLSDNPFQYQQRFGNSVRGYRVKSEFFYAQDDYRISRNLTLNLGLRLEIAHGSTEVNNLLSNIDPTLTSAQLGGAGAGPLGSFYTGGTFSKTNYNPGPRFGFAWTPGGGLTVIRGGYGISYDFIYQNPITNGRFLPPLMYLFTLTQGNFTGSNALANILAGSSAFQATNAGIVGTFGTTLKNFGAVTYIDPSLKNPQVQQFTLTVERPLYGNWIGRVSYSGSKGNYLQRTQPLNFLAPGVFTPPTTKAQQDAEQAAKVYSTLNSGLSGSATSRSNRIDGRFNAVSYVTSGANSNYHSLQASIEHRFSHGYLFRTAYTWSKSIDDVSDALGVLANDSAGQQNPLNNRSNRAVSAFDATHRLVIAHSFEPRVRFGNKVTRQILDNWQFSGIFQAQTGFPVLFRAGTVAGLTDGTLLGGNGIQRPDLVGTLNVNWSPDPGGGSVNFNKVTGSGLAAPLVGHFGTLGRNVSRLNPLINSDFTLGRAFALFGGDRVRLLFQAQLNNAFNNTTFAAPNTAEATLSSPGNFGYYQGTELDTRRILLVGRVVW